MAGYQLFLAGFLVGVVGALLLMLKTRCCKKSPPPESQGTIPHTDEQAASEIAHKKGIEVFDD